MNFTFTVHVEYEYDPDVREFLQILQRVARVDPGLGVKVPLPVQHDLGAGLGAHRGLPGCAILGLEHRFHVADGREQI